MSFRWLKPYMPRSLYGRAALIIVLPVLTLQMLISVLFAQRHFEDVTLQMTASLERELDLIVRLVDLASNREAALLSVRPFVDALQLDMRFVTEEAVPTSDVFVWYDYTGRIMARALRESVPATRVVDMSDDNRPNIYLNTTHGPFEITLDRWRVTPSTPHQFLVIMISFGALMTVIAYIYMRNQLRPVTRLASAAEAFGRGRRQPYVPGGAIEVRAAGQAFLDMRARIERHIEQRTLMLSGVSHDLRTPLTRLKLGLSMIDPDEAEPLLRDVDEMQHLLDAFLDFSRDMGESKPQKVEPRTLVAQIVEDAQRAGKSVTLVDKRIEGPVMIRVVPIRRAVENLINNAVRYGSVVRVSVRRTEKFLRIRVEDDGPGIPPEQRAEAVKPFARLDPARNQNKGSGVGLGLAIVADVARAHGGTLRLGTSKDLGGLQADILIAL
ncbi:MAG: two-component sensor histidine kinase [Rhodobacteraceae bacterium]|nr:two-component sensor histidine kinase [Paracoccaceae bacterium]